MSKQQPIATPVEAGVDLSTTEGRPVSRRPTNVTSMALEAIRGIAAQRARSDHPDLAARMVTLRNNEPSGSGD